MKSSGLVIAAALLAALTGVLYWSDHHKTDDKPIVSADAPPKIFTLKDTDISKIAIKKKGVEEVALAKNDAGKWQITAPTALSADQDSVSSMVSTLSTLGSDRLVADKAEDLGQYGLAQPSLEADITLKDNKSQKLLIGDDTPTSNGAFAMVAGDPRIFTVASYTKTSVDKSANDLRDKRLMTADFDKISQLQLSVKKQDIEFGRNKEAWQIVKPKPLRADNSQVEDLVRQLKDAKMETGGSDADEKKSVSAFASGSPFATAKVTDASGTQELQVRQSKDKNDYYAKSSAVAGVYKVSSALGKGLDKNLDDFRNKKLFDFGFDEPSKVEMHDGTKAYFLTKGGQDWWSDGKKMDVIGVQSFVDKVRELSASKFPDSGFSTPVVDLTVTSSDGKRVEKVLISKAGDQYLAKRENEPALYELTAAAVSELQKSAADVKPAEEPKPAPATKK
jgi:Domain of unknown function (DUF4340)